MARRSEGRGSSKERNVQALASLSAQGRHSNGHSNGVVMTRAAGEHTNGSFDDMRKDLVMQAADVIETHRSLPYQLMPPFTASLAPDWEPERGTTSTTSTTSSAAAAAAAAAATVSVVHDGNALDLSAITSEYAQMVTEAVAEAAVAEAAKAKALAEQAQRQEVTFGPAARDPFASSSQAGSGGGGGRGGRHGGGSGAAGGGGRGSVARGGLDGTESGSSGTGGTCSSCTAT